MKNQNNISITRKMILIFIAVVVLETFLFVMAISFSIRSIKKTSTTHLIKDYLSSAKIVAEEVDIPKNIKDDHGYLQYKKFQEIKAVSVGDVYGFVLYSNEEVIPQVPLPSNLRSDADFLIEMISIARGKTVDSFEISIEATTGSVFIGVVVLSNGDKLVAFSTGEYLNNESFKSLLFTIVAYFLITFFGDFIIIIWIKSLVKRINQMSDFVSSMKDNNYRYSFIDDGDDEIELLSEKIDMMRKKIVQDELVKEAMLQNISHDLKTPIAVIRSYAEAIGDGIEGTDKTEIIIEQAIKLDKKVKNLIEFNKLEYLLLEGKTEEVKIAPIVTSIVENCKHIKENIKFVVDVDDSTFIGKEENYYTAFENIIENATRYAKTVIEVVLKDGALTIYNDGEPIADTFIQNGFRPYETGHAGKFGLGMSIVTKTLEYFHMKLTCENVRNGVIFTIKEDKED